MSQSGTLLGRTNRIFPQTWWRITGTQESERDAVRAHLAEHPAPIMAGAYWADAVRDLDLPWLARGGSIAGQSLSRSHADDLVSMEIIQAVASSPDGKLAIYFLSVSSAWEEFQIDGALAAMDAARQDGLLDFFGLHIAGSVVAISSMWRFHDAFEVVLASAQNEKDFRTVHSTAVERRVGVIQEGEGPHRPRLLTVNSVADMQGALA